MGHGVGHHIDISIHALREEGDSRARSPLCVISLFLSTPSVRRATVQVLPDADFHIISIHALREEGDLEWAMA